MDDDLLTPNQRDPLLAMVRFQQQQGREVAFTIPLGGQAISADNGFYAMPPLHARELWQQQNYIFISQGQKHWPDPQEAGTYFSQDALLLSLTQKAIDYEAWVRKPGWQRWLIRQARAVSSELRAALISLITALITSVLTLFLLKWLGLS